MKKKWLVILFFLLGTNPLFSQSESAKDTIPVIKDISIINEEILRSTNLIKKIDGDISEKLMDSLSKVSAQLCDTSNFHLDNFLTIQDNDARLRSIEIKLSELKFLKIEIDDFLKSINILSQGYGTNLEKLNVEEQKWNNTLKYLGELEVGELSSLNKIIKDQIISIDKTKKRLLINYNQVLIIQGRLNLLVMDFEQTIEQVDQIIEHKKRDLFKLDSPPIWNVSLNLKGIQDQLKADLKSLVMVSYSYLGNNTKLLVTFILIFALLLAIFLYLRKYYYRVLPGLESDSRVFVTTDDYNKLKIFKRPFSLAILISLMILLYTAEVPIELSEVTILVLVIPILLILRERVVTKYYKFIFIILSIFFIQIATGIIFYTHVLSRVLNFIMVFILVLIIIYINRKVLGKVSKKDFAFKKLLLVISHSVVALLFVAFISNMVGNEFLCDSILFSTMTSLFGGFVYSICFLISSQIIVLLNINQTRKGSGIFIRNRRKLGNQIRGFLFFVFFIIWIDLVLRLFSINELVYELVRKIFEYSFKLGDINVIPANLFILVFVIWGTFKFSKFLRAILENDILARLSLPRGMPGTISMLTSYAVMLIGFFIAVLAAGIQLDKLTIIVGGLGVGIGFGLQNIINNFISGLILAFERPIKKGDVIQIAELMGTVKEIGIRSSTIRSFDGAEVIMPNGNLISNELINWTLSDKFRRIELRVGVAYGTDPDKVLNILKMAMSDHEKVMDTPPPMALFVGFGDSSLDFRLLFWTNDFDNWLSLQSEINVKINHELNKAGIEIPFPQRDLHIRSIDKDVKLPPSVK